LYDLSQEDLVEAFETLHSHSFILGPATDGGYYLLGMNKLKETVFFDKAWGTENVFKETLKDLEGEDLALLKEKNDVDYYEDIKDIPIFRQFFPAHLKI